MEIKVKLQTITIKDENTSEEFVVRSLRTAQDIASYVGESEKDDIVCELERRVNDAINS